MSPKEASDAVASENPPFLLDVRQPEEHEFAALSGSTLIPLGEIPGRVKEIERMKDRTILVYCHHGVRSQRAVAFLRQLGFKDVRNLDGGIDAWSLLVDPAIRRY